MNSPVAVVTLLSVLVTYWKPEFKYAKHASLVSLVHFLYMDHKYMLIIIHIWDYLTNKVSLCT